MITDPTAINQCFGVVEALGLDEVAFLREAPYYRTQFSTSIVDVASAQLLDVAPGRSGKESTEWIERQDERWLAHVRHAPWTYRARRLLTKAEERLSNDDREKLLGLLRAGDPEGHVATTWQAKELIRSLYDHENETLALKFITRLGQDFKGAAPPQVRSLGRTLLK